eukprot:TRINITY_DN5538_c0_g1_i1.p1 TRINITY_DN5538_c0_g1~~TRINITY_DN5538_c0_g1_i1.p1  ORF type:complete len:882 (+),score=209.44 TRINITY_DN5538_c0_g1_i1:2026-4671(+)
MTGQSKKSLNQRFFIFPGIPTTSLPITVCWIARWLFFRSPSPSLPWHTSSAKCWTHDDFSGRCANWLDHGYYLYPPVAARSFLLKMLIELARKVQSTWRAAASSSAATVWSSQASWLGTGETKPLGRARAWQQASAKRSTRPAADTTAPLTPSCTNSEAPAARVVTTGRPACRASRQAMEQGSQMVGSTRASAAASRGATADRNPKKRTRSPTPREAARPFQPWARSRPATSRTASGMRARACRAKIRPLRSQPEPRNRRTGCPSSSPSSCLACSRMAASRAGARSSSSTALQMTLILSPGTWQKRANSSATRRLMAMTVLSSGAARVRRSNSSRARCLGFKPKLRRLNQDSQGARRSSQAACTPSPARNTGLPGTRSMLKKASRPRPRAVRRAAAAQGAGLAGCTGCRLMPSGGSSCQDEAMTCSSWPRSSRPRASRPSTRSAPPVRSYLQRIIPRRISGRPCQQAVCRRGRQFQGHLLQTAGNLGPLAPIAAAGMLRAIAHHHLGLGLPGAPHGLARGPEYGQHRHPQGGGHVHGRAVHPAEEPRPLDEPAQHVKVQLAGQVQGHRAGRQQVADALHHLQLLGVRPGGEHHLDPLPGQMRDEPCVARRCPGLEHPARRGVHQRVRSLPYSGLGQQLAGLGSRLVARFELEGRVRGGDAQQLHLAQKRLDHVVLVVPARGQQMKGPAPETRLLGPEAHPGARPADPGEKGPPVALGQFQGQVVMGGAQRGQKAHLPGQLGQTGTVVPLEHQNFPYQGIVGHHGLGALVDQHVHGQLGPGLLERGDHRGGHQHVADVPQFYHQGLAGGWLHFRRHAHSSWGEASSMSMMGMPSRTGQRRPQAAQTSQASSGVGSTGCLHWGQARISSSSGFRAMFTPPAAT